MNEYGLTSENRALHIVPIQSAELKRQQQLRKEVAGLLRTSVVEPIDTP